MTKIFRNIFRTQRLIHIGLIGLLLITASCGGGGGSSSDTSSPAPNPGTNPNPDPTPNPTPNPTPSSSLTSANSTAVAGAVVASGNLLIEPSYIGTADVNSRSAHMSFLMSLLNNSIEAIRDSGSLKTAGTRDTTTNCTGGGTRKEVSQWTGSDSDPQNYTGTITYTNCKEGTETWNGTVRMTYEGLTSAPAKITTVINTTYANTSASANLTISGVTIVYSDLIYASGQLTSGAATLTGSISGTVNGKAISAGYESFKIAYSYSGNTMTIQMTGRINPSCTNSWVTVSTPASLTLPTATSCYTAGEMRITDGSSTVSVSFTYSNVSVSFNSASVGAFNDCSEIQGLCSN